MSMPREQRTQLNKRRGTEVPLGKYGSGRTQTVNMPAVAPVKSDGAKLAESLGMVVETGMKVYQMDQATRKEKSQLQVQAEKSEWVSILNNLGSAEERAQWVESKMHSLKGPDVDENYRNAAIGALNPFYTKYIPEAKREFNEGLQGKATNITVGLLEEGTFNIANLQASPAFARMDNNYKHTAITNGITAHYTNAIAGASTVEELYTLETQMKTTLAEYNKSPYYGGSAAKSALNLKTKMTKALTTGISTQRTALGKVATDTIENLKAKNATYTDVEQAVNAHPTMSKLDKETELIKYKAVSDKFQRTEEFKQDFNVHNSSNNVKYSGLNADEKKAADAIIQTNLDYAQNNRAWNSFALTATTNEIVGKTRMKTTFGSWQADSEDTIGKNLTMYKELKDVEHGGRALTFLSPDTLAFYSLLDTNPNMDVEMLRGSLLASKEQNAYFGDSNSQQRKNRKDLRELKENLAPFERNVADKLFKIYSNNMDADDAVDMVEKHYTSLNTQEGDEGMTFRGFAPSIVNYAEDGLKNYIFKEAGIDTNNLHVSMEAGEMTIYDAKNPLMHAIRMPYSSFVETVASLKAEEVSVGMDIGAGGITSAKKQAFTNSMRNPYYDDYDESWIGKMWYGQDTGEGMVDNNFLRNQEGGYVQRAYVPTSKGEILGHSGVTIGAGVDLGQWDAASLKAAGISDRIINQVSPALGKQGNEAVNIAARMRPMSKQDVVELTDKVHNHNVEQIGKAYGAGWEQLTRGQRTVIASVALQYGIQGIQGHNFWTQVKEGEWDKALANLRNYQDKYPSRRNREADLLEKE